MKTNHQMQDLSRFNIVFEKLEEAKKEQDFNFNLDLEAVAEANETISLFKEYQESFVESSVTMFTKS